MSAVPPSAQAPAWHRTLSAKTLGVLAVLGLVVAFSLSSTLVKRWSLWLVATGIVLLT